MFFALFLVSPLIPIIIIAEITVADWGQTRCNYRSRSSLVSISQSKSSETQQHIQFCVFERLKDHDDCFRSFSSLRDVCFVLQYIGGGGGGGDAFRISFFSSSFFCNTSSSHWGKKVRTAIFPVCDQACIIRPCTERVPVS